jgi:hypothetical protein
MAESSKNRKSEKEAKESKPSLLGSELNKITDRLKHHKIWIKGTGWL